MRPPKIITEITHTLHKFVRKLNATANRRDAKASTNQSISQSIGENLLCYI